MSTAKERKKALAAHHRMVRKWENFLLPFTNKYMKYLREDLSKNIRDATGKTPSKKIKNWIDWNQADHVGVMIYKPPLLRILQAAGDVAIHVKKQDSFDPIIPEATLWAMKHSAELVTGINKVTMNGLREIIYTLLPPGSDLWEYQKLIRPLVGLTEPHVKAVSNLYTRLLEEGINEERALAMAARKAGRLHRYRALMISRTETANALLQGQVRGYKQIGGKELERIEDPDCCDVCAEINGAIYPIKEASAIGTLHPNCEGTWVLAL